MVCMQRKMPKEPFRWLRLFEHKWTRWISLPFVVIYVSVLRVFFLCVWINYSAKFEMESMNLHVNWLWYLILIFWANFITNRVLLVSEKRHTCATKVGEEGKEQINVITHKGEKKVICIKWCFKDIYEQVISASILESSIFHWPSEAVKIFYIERN